MAGGREVETNVSEAQGEAGDSKRPRISARELAGFAEHAHGFMGEPLILVTTRDGEILLKRPEEKVDSDNVVCDVETAKKQPARGKLERLALKVEGAAETEIRDRFDAIFWTESAMEKFLLPYYHAQRVLTDNDMNRLMAAVRDRNVVAIAHTWRTRYETVDAVDAGTGSLRVLAMSGPAVSGEAPLVMMELDEFFSRQAPGVQAAGTADRAPAAADTMAAPG